MIARIALVVSIVGILSAILVLFVESYHSRGETLKQRDEARSEKQFVENIVIGLEYSIDVKRADIDFLLSEEERKEENLRKLDQEKYLLAIALGEKVARAEELRSEIEERNRRIRVRQEVFLREPSHCPKGYSFTAKATGYSSTPDQTQGDPFTTATGTTVHWGTIAVDPAVIPYGCSATISAFPDTVFTAEDTGGAILGAGYRIDIWFSSTNEALNFGVQFITVTVQ